MSDGLTGATMSIVRGADVRPSGGNDGPSSHMRGHGQAGAIHHQRPHPSNGLWNVGPSPVLPR